MCWHPQGACAVCIHKVLGYLSIFKSVVFSTPTTLSRSLSLTPLTLCIPCPFLTHIVTPGCFPPYAGFHPVSKRLMELCWEIHRYGNTHQHHYHLLFSLTIPSSFKFLTTWQRESCPIKSNPEESQQCVNYISDKRCTPLREPVTSWTGGASGLAAMLRKH